MNEYDFNSTSLYMDGIYRDPPVVKWKHFNIGNRDDKYY